MELYLAPQDFREFLFHAEKGKTGDMTWLEFHQHVNITITPEIIPQHGAEKGAACGCGACGSNQPTSSGKP